MLIHLQDICGCFPTILAELNSYDTHCMTFKPEVVPIRPFTGKVCKTLKINKLRS